MNIDDEYIKTYAISLCSWSKLVKSSKEFKTTVAELIYIKNPVTREQAQDIAQSIAIVKGME